MLDTLLYESVCRLSSSVFTEYFRGLLKMGVAGRKTRLPAVVVVVLLAVLAATSTDAQKAKYSLALTGIDSGTGALCCLAHILTPTHTPQTD